MMRMSLKRFQYFKISRFKVFDELHDAHEPEKTEDHDGVTHS